MIGILVASKSYRTEEILHRRELVQDFYDIFSVTSVQLTMFLHADSLFYADCILIVISQESETVRQ